MWLGLAAALTLLAWYLWPPAPAPQFGGDFDLVLVAKEDKPLPRQTPVGALDTLPLRPGNGLIVQGRLDKGPSAFFYLIWIDTRGEPKPRYPAKWALDMLPPVEEIQSELRWPTEGGWQTLHEPPDGDGMESVLCLVRQKALTRQDNARIKTLLDDLKWQTPASWKGKDFIVRWKNGQRMTSDLKGPDDVVHLADDPIIQTEKLLLAFKEQKLAQFSFAICYSLGGR